MSRTGRWAVACARALEARGALEAALEDLKEIQTEYEEWRDGLPENLSGSAVAEKLDAVCGIDFEISFDCLDEADGIDLPLGFGRD